MKSYTDLVDVVIFAAGKGTRINADRPKPLVEILGKPIITYILENIEKSELAARPIIVVSPEGKMRFKKALQSYNCRFVVQKEAMGMANALSEVIAGGMRLKENLLCLVGDNPLCSAQTIEKLAALQVKSGGMITMLTTLIPEGDDMFRNLHSYARVVRDQAGNVLKTVDPAEASKDEIGIREVNPTLYGFNTKWVEKHLKELKLHPGKQEYYLTDLLELASQEGGAIYTGQVSPIETFGVNTPEELEVARQVLYQKDVVA
jgi:bifunctional UDP-N-acetylglucosamine pyrophosphorylase / glucosamine-1-phosphate N-acetyltransferase